MQNPFLDLMARIITTKLETVEYVSVMTQSLQVCSASLFVHVSEFNVGNKYEIPNTQRQYKNNFHINTLRSKICLNYIQSISSYFIVNILYYSFRALFVQLATFNNIRTQRDSKV
jgi:hypothetical protein